MTNNVQFKGIIPPVSTLVHKDRSIDEKGMKALIDYLIDEGVNGLFFLGSGGEFSQMSVAERKAVAEFATKYVNHRVPVLIGTGSTNTEEAIELSKHAEQIGADGVVVINPYYIKLSEEALYEYYARIAKAVNISVLLYNFPALTGQHYDGQFILKLVKDHDNIVGIKETVNDVAIINDVILTVKSQYPQFAVLAGFDDYLLHTLAAGGDGAICATTNFFPQFTVGLYNSFLAGDLQTVTAHHQKLIDLVKIYNFHTPFIGVVKEALKINGLDVSTEVLSPALPLDEKKKAELKEILAAFK